MRLFLHSDVITASILHNFLWDFIH